MGKSRSTTSAGWARPQSHRAARRHCFGAGMAAGFTVVELLVVLACIALLLSVAVPRYLQHLSVARDTVLKEDLFQMRDAIDKFYGDQSHYPATLDELVARHYLRAVPVDPLTDRSDTWLVVPATGTAAGVSGTLSNVRSGAKGQASDGSDYASW